MCTSEDYDYEQEGNLESLHLNATAKYEVKQYSTWLSDSRSLQYKTM